MMMNPARMTSLRWVNPPKTSPEHWDMMRHLAEKKCGAIDTDGGTLAESLFADAKVKLRRHRVKLRPKPLAPLSEFFRAPERV
jgi:hypothetical protein